MADIDLPDNPFVPPKGGRCIINELPSELLSHIFTLGWTPERDRESEEEDLEDVDDGDSEDSYSTASTLSDRDRSPSRRHAEDEDEERKARKLPFNVLVSHVCAEWRAIALDNSLLWTHIQFVGEPPYERALTYLSRATTAPLAITIDRTVEDKDNLSITECDVSDDEQPKDNDPDLTIITGIMDVIVPHIEHIQALQIMVSFYPQIHRALEKLGTCKGAPMLEVLQLYHYEDTDEHEMFKSPELRDQPFRLFSGNAPRLTHVALWGVHLPWSKESAPFLTGLTDLELAYHARDVRPSFSDFARILRSSPDLRTLTLCLSCPAGTPSDWPSSGLPCDEVNGGGAADGSSTAPLVLSRLEDLVLAYIEPQYLLSLLPRLSLPALTSLALDLEDEDYSDFLSYLASPRSLPPQRSLLPAALRGPGVEGSPPRARSLLSNLKSLKIASLPCSEQVVADAYRQLEKLTSLNVNMLYLGEYWLDLLVPSSTVPAPTPVNINVPGFVATAFARANANATPNQPELFLPRLESLTTTGVEGSRIRDLVEARAEHGAPIKTLLMNQDDVVEPEDEEWLGENVERFEYFEGSDEEEVDIVEDGFEDENGEWEDEDEEEDDFDDGPEIIILPF